MNRKNIAFIIGHLGAGGAERVISTISNQLCEEFNVTIIVFYKCIPFYTLNSNINVVFCLKEYNESPSMYSSISTHIKIIRKIFSTVKKLNIDLLIGFMTQPNIYAVIVSKISRAKCIINERANPKLDNINPAWRKIRKIFYPITNKLVLQSNAVKAYYKDFINPSKMEVINNPLSDKLLEKKNQSLKKEKSILCVGRLDKAKNHELLVRAFSNIEAKGWKLKIAGDGVNKDYLKGLIKSLNKEDEILLMGNVPNIVDYYNVASIFVLTSNHEGFPNALIEAMCFGLACISTNCEYGPSELIEDSVNGFLIPVNDQIELEKKLKQLLLNPTLRQQFGEKAMECESMFNGNYIANNWKELIYKTLK